MKTLLAALFAAALAFPAAAQMYKWVDKDGKVRYGDTPPPGAKTTAIQAPPPPASSSSRPAAAAGKGTEKPLSAEEAFQKRRKDAAEAEQKADKERADADAKRANCDGARQNLRTYESGQRLSTIGANGERSYMDDAARASGLEQARKSVAEWCN